MAIGMIELQGAIQRTQDYSAMKHQEDAKGTVDQSHLQAQADRKTDQKASQIQQGDDANKSDTRADAREQGKGTYAGDGGQHRKKQDKPSDGKVILKGKGNTHFDMSV